MVKKKNIYFIYT